MRDDLHCVSDDEVVVKDRLSDALVFLGSVNCEIVHLAKCSKRVYWLLLPVRVHDVIIEGLLIWKGSLARLALDCHDCQGTLRKRRMWIGFARRGFGRQRRVDSWNVKQGPAVECEIGVRVCHHHRCAHDWRRNSRAWSDF